MYFERGDLMRRYLRQSLAAVAAVVALALTGSANAANSGIFSDPAGDNGGAGTSSFALDVISTQVVSQDNGLVTFTVTLQTPDVFQGKMFLGDEVDVLVDGDNNPSTGDNGLEGEFKAFGANTSVTDNQPVTGQFCSLSGTNLLACEPILPENFSSVDVPPTNHVLTFTLVQSDLTTIGFAVVTTFSSNHDRLPDTGFIPFDLRADPDGDGKTGDGDLCPTKPGGNYDTDDDGCPGPYLVLPKIGIKYGPYVKSSAWVRYSSFGVNVPSSVNVTVRAGRQTFRRHGSGVIRGLTGRTLAAGLTITITISQPGHCSSQRVIRIRPSSSNGYVDVSNRAGIKPGGGIACAT